MSTLETQLVQKIDMKIRGGEAPQWTKNFFPIYYFMLNGYDIK